MVLSPPSNRQLCAHATHEVALCSSLSFLVPPCSTLCNLLCLLSLRFPLLSRYHYRRQLRQLCSRWRPRHSRARPSVRSATSQLLRSATAWRPPRRPRARSAQLLRSATAKRSTPRARCSQLLRSATAKRSTPRARCSQLLRSATAKRSTPRARCSQLLRSATAKRSTPRARSGSAVKGEWKLRLSAGRAPDRALCRAPIRALCSGSRVRHQQQSCLHACRGVAPP
jgi:hypothetical protein